VEQGIELRQLEVARAAQRPLDVAHRFERHPRHDAQYSAIGLQERENRDAFWDLVRHASHRRRTQQQERAENGQRDWTQARNQP